METDRTFGKTGSGDRQEVEKETDRQTDWKAKRDGTEVGTDNMWKQREGVEAEMKYR